MARGDFQRLDKEGREHCREQARERDYLGHAIDREADRALTQATPDRDHEHDHTRGDTGWAARERERERTIDRRQLDTLSDPAPLRKTTSIHQQLRDLEGELTALAEGLAGPAPRLPHELPRKVEITG